MSIVEKAIGKLRSEARLATKPVEPAVRRPEPAAHHLPVRSAELAVRVDTAGDCVSKGPPVAINLEALRRAGGLPAGGRRARRSRTSTGASSGRCWSAPSDATWRPLPDGNLVMVTSALPGDGKTFTSLNLALSIARERDSSVLLIDADIAKGHVSELLNIRDRPGLTDLLENPHADPADFVLPTDVDGLRIMAAGRRGDQVPELLASQRMRSIISELGARNRERVIIFDSSPLLATNESQVLAKLVGQVLMVVRANGTPRPAVEEAVALLDRSKAISLVLNQTRTIFGLGTHYSGYYNYGGSSS